MARFLRIRQPVRVLVVMGMMAEFSLLFPLQATCTPAFGGIAPISSTKPRTLHRGFGFIVIKESSNTRNAKSPRVFEVMDGKALPNILDRCSMSFFQPPPLNTLERYQLEFLESIFKQV